MNAYKMNILFYVQIFVKLSGLFLGLRVEIMKRENEEIGRSNTKVTPIAINTVWVNVAFTYSQ